MRTSWQNILRQLGLARPQGTIRWRRPGLQVETLEDRTTPTALVSVTGAPNPLTDAAIPGTFAFRVLFDAQMNTGVAPAIAFPTAGENPGASLSFANGHFETTTIANDTYVANYNATDQNVAIPNIDVQVSGARDFGNALVTTQTVNNVFSIDTQSPVVASVQVSDTFIDASNVGQTFSIAITYEEAMRTNLAPTITFSQNVSSTLTFSTGSWNAGGTVYTANYTIGGNNNVVASVNINVAGAQNLANFVQLPFTQANAFTIDTRPNSSGVFPTGSSARLVGDFNGDTLSDVAAYYPSTGRWFVSLSTGSSFLAPQAWSNFGATSFARQMVGDFNNDGKDDIANFEYVSGSRAKLWVSISNGSNFTTTLWANYGATLTSTGWRTQLVGDFNGDGKDDIASFLNPTGHARWWVSLSSGTGFTTTLWADLRNLTTTDWTTFVAGDFNNDLKTDIANLANPGVARWWVSISGGASFTTTNWGSLPTSSRNAWDQARVGDFNNDGRIDIASYNRVNGDLWVNLSNGTSFTSTLWLDLLPSNTYVLSVGDFNNDSRTDVSVISTTANPIVVGRSTGTGFAASQWGILPFTSGLVSELVGDFNGDGRDDLAHFFTVSGGMQWWVNLATSGNSFTAPTRWR